MLNAEPAGLNLSALDARQLRRWFELDLDLVGRVVPVDPLPVYQQAQADDRPDWAAAAVVLAVGLIFSEGRHFDRLDGWTERANGLLAGGRLSSVAKAALGVARLLAGLIGPAALRQVQSQAAQTSAAVLESESDPLQLYFAAIHSHALLMAGDMEPARQCIQDALHLASAAPGAVLPRLYLAGADGMLDALAGDGRRGDVLLRGILEHPLAPRLPPVMLTMARAHRLLCLAKWANAEQLDAEAELLRCAVIPAHNAYQRSYLHFSLGVAALWRGQPAQALAHAGTAIEHGRLARSGSAELVPALLQLQALVDLGRHEQAQACHTEHLAAWQDHGMVALEVSAWVEVARSRLRHGSPEGARRALHAAINAWPTGQPLCDLNRPAGLAERLRAQLLPPRSLPVEGDHQDLPVRVGMLGPLALQVGPRLLTDREWRGRRSKALLKALVVLGGHKVPADALCDLLWPDADGGQARQNLKVALWRLRRAGLARTPGAAEPPAWVVMRHGEVSLVRALCQVDALQFLDTPDDPDTSAGHAALALYCDDFLAGDDSLPWLAPFRQRLRARYRALVCQLAGRDDNSAQQSVALRARLEAITAADPLDEPSHEALMRLCLRAGWPAQAVRAYQRLEHQLRLHLGARPGRALSLLLGEATAAADDTDSPPTQAHR
ncbi:DNA-binding transcriptional activator of the SARP family [Burkholderiales bacterium JOSHI_001]|nr:DNA-binding transcriptional activator of the SARP family [Burkholderiales bacterium JOSHI_001]